LGDTVCDASCDVENCGFDAGDCGTAKLKAAAAGAADAAAAAAAAVAAVAADDAIAATTVGDATVARSLAILPLSLHSLSTLASLPPSFAASKGHDNNNNDNNNDINGSGDGGGGGGSGSGSGSDSGSGAVRLFAHLPLVAPLNAHVIAVNFTAPLARISGAAHDDGGGVRVRKAVAVGVSTCDPVVFFCFSLFM
jgi:hypothetical protein